MKVLVINTYAGSLLLGARALGVDIVGSYEDVGFAVPIQETNFPNVDIRPFRKDWPDPCDLSDTFIIAHPPCSAFSSQNTSKKAKGLDSKAFACTKNVLDYAVRNNALGVAIESVVGALAGAWKIHERAAHEGGYNIYRILQNGAMFAPQWRERFWVVMIKKGTAPEKMTWVLDPKWTTVGQATEGWLEGPSCGNTDRLLERLKTRLLEEAGCTDDDMSYFFDPQDPPHGTCMFNDVFWPRMFPDHDRWEVQRKYIGLFASGTLCFLNPNGLAPVLLGGAWWYMHGRNLSENAYKRIMGFPGDYFFPEYPKNFRSNMRWYMSKGVIPQVAEWILEQVANHFGWTWSKRPQPSDNAYTITVDNEGIADFRIRKRDLKENPIHPPLRNDDDKSHVEPEFDSPQRSLFE